MLFKKRGISLQSVFVLTLLALASLSAYAANWYPVSVLGDGKKLEYKPLLKASKSWRICALLPHGQDQFWWGVAWGLTEEAKSLNTKLGVYQAGGYGNLNVQRQQFNRCMAKKADAIILAAISPEGLEAERAKAKERHIVVIDMINEVKSDTHTASVGSDTFHLGSMSARYILQQSKGKTIKVAWFPGPKNMNWVNHAQEGVFSVFKLGAAELLQGGYGVPEMTVQMSLIRAVFSGSSPDYVLANAVAAEAACRYLANHKYAKTQVVSYYATEPVVDLIRKGKVLAAPSNAPITQARIAFDLAIRALEKQPFPNEVRVIPEMIDATNVNQFQAQTLYAPTGTWMRLQELPD